MTAIESGVKVSLTDGARSPTVAANTHFVNVAPGSSASISLNIAKVILTQKRRQPYI